MAHVILYDIFQLNLISNDLQRTDLTVVGCYILL